jgi:hypothetical protein
MGEIAANLARNLVHNLFEGKFAKFLRELLPTLKKVSAKFLLLILAIGWSIYDLIITPFLHAYEGIVIILAERLAINDPQVRQAAVEMAKSLFNALRENFTIAQVIICCSLTVLILAVGLPILYKWISRRNLTVFISFNRMREGISQSLQRDLEHEGVRVVRIPFQESADHQKIVVQVTEGIRKCDGFVCLPGFNQSYVEHEVAAATIYHKSVAFLISERSGTLPDTADKRYPIFRLETTMRERFRPLIGFLSYVGADFKSTWNLCKRALRHPFFVISPWLMFIVLAMCVVVLFGYCFWDASDKALQLTHNNPGFEQVKTIAVLANALVLGVLMTLAFSSCSYSSLVSMNLMMQRRARNKARLRTVTGEFSRDDWVGIIPELSPAGNLYESLFAAAPLAHHEIGIRPSA